MLIVLTSLMIVGILWARDKSRDEVCNEIRVEVVNDDSTHFVTRAGVLEEMERKHIIVKGKPIWQINVEDIEAKLMQSQYIESVQCMFEDGGSLKIKVAQIVPVMRVFDGDHSYYLNKNGKRMPAVSTFYADVPIVEGHFTRQYSPLRLLPMIRYVESDSSLNALVTMYCMRDTNNIFIVPSIHGHVVNMGQCNDFANKFAKLKLFYKKVMPVKGWMYYDTISVKWDHQVVATRRDKVVERVQEYNPEEDEQADDPGTMRISDNSKAPVNKMTREKQAPAPAPAATQPSAPKPAAAKPAGQPSKPPEQKAPAKSTPQKTAAAKPASTAKPAATKPAAKPGKNKL